MTNATLPRKHYDQGVAVHRRPVDGSRVRTALTRSVRSVAGAAIAVLVSGLALAACMGPPAAGPAVGLAGSVRRIGTYDSRALAVAWVGTPSFNAWMQPLSDEHATAKAAGDGPRIKELQAEGEARQRQLHMQGFSTAPVGNVLETIRERLPAIRQQAGVEMLVSKWDRDGLARYPGAERVDVTMALVEALQPNPRQRQSAIEVQKHDPIPLEDARNLKD